MNTDQPVCVTGASGFVAAHVVRELLSRSYRVRGTVRGLSKSGKYDYLTALPGAAKRLELVEAELLRDGSYDTAVADCAFVIHTASPYTVSAKDPQRDLVDPAVNGTLNVLRSAEKAGVRRVVLTSSMAAISDEPDDNKVFTEADWNEKSTLKRNPYYLSKTVAEQSAWQFVNERDPGFDLVVVNPYMVIGPSLGPGLNPSNGIFRDILRGAFPGILNLNWGLVDVRDVAKAHVLAMENPSASGRYLCSGETRTMREVVSILEDAGFGSEYKLPRRNLTNGLATFVIKLLSYTQPKGTGSYMRTHLGKTMRYDNAKIRNELGISFTPARESICAAIENMKAWDHLKPPK